jgi:nitroreductase
MEFADVVRRRRMVRRYADRPVDPAALERMLAHAVRAPSAGFSQGWAFLVLDTADDVARFWESTSTDPDATNAWLDGMRTAPVVIVPLSCRDAYLDRYAEQDKAASGRGGPADDPESVAGRWPIPYWHVDTGMAALLILQTAVDEGLGACFFGIPPERVGAFREAFGVPADHTPIGAITVGHPAAGGSTGSPARRGRRAGVVHRGRW